MHGQAPALCWWRAWGAVLAVFLHRRGGLWVRDPPTFFYGVCGYKCGEVREEQSQTPIGASLESELEMAQKYMKGPLAAK